ncbi:hypothetical protein BGZ52_008727 [Haplosporangium bisporale]|nr:hypothetical protein BGZ52_008727 [Haplosporangium bisporale]KAF9211395.1 hypothetical protein BGZ59_008137 [Podila verticillata]KAI9234670.1 MAG: hypothetical protein BYD32DRAFT_439017 [Podila humilis]KFH70517.1 hypothetical protein MVEG_03367 [Podila verticillata NRRL 6337]
MATVDPISVSITTPCLSTSNSELSLSSLAASALEDSDLEHQEQQPNKLSPYDKHPYTLSKDTDLGYASATGSTISLGTATKTVVSHTTTTTTTSPSPPISPLASTLQTSPSSPTPSASISHNAPATSSEVDMMASLDEVLMRKSAPTSDYYSTGGSDSGHDEATSRDTSAEQHQQNHEQILQPQDKNHSRFSTTGSDADLIDRERDFRAQHEENTPTLEQMGLDKLDELELRMLLQNAYEVIQEKERDLGMAAMMGQGLVESHTTLQAKYQHILTQLRQQRLHRPRQLTPPRTIILSPPPELPGGDVDDDNSGDENWVDFEPSRSSSHHLSSSYPNSPTTVGPFAHHVSFRRSTSHNGLMRSRSRQDIEKLATLEDMNQELQAKVDAATKELKQGRRQAFKRHRKAEQELKAIKDELERTTVKVVDLEEQNGRLIEASRMIRMRRILLKNQLPAPGSIPGSTMAAIAVEMQGDEMTIQEMLAEDNRIFEELRDRLQSLERKNVSLAHQKTEADKKTQELAQDLADMQKDHEDLLTNLCGFSDLQTAYDEQTAHVKELENNIQELQNQISTMSSRLSQMNSPLMSPSEPSSPMQSFWRRDDADFKALKTILHGSSPQTVALKSPGLRGQKKPRRTLLAELESEWFRDVSFFGPPRVVEQPQTIHMNPPKSPKALKNKRHDSESESFSDDTGGRVKGWRERIQDMDEDEACESSSCIRKRRNHKFKYNDMTSDTDGGVESHGMDGDDSDVEQFHLFQQRKRRLAGLTMIDDSDCLSDCSDPSGHHDLHRRSSTPGCCCHMYDDYSGYTSYDDEHDEEESMVGWAHFEDYDASALGYDKYRDGYYIGRRNRRSIMGMIQGVFLMFRLLWRWCRFICILSTALGMAIYRGPDALLTDGQ